MASRLSTFWILALFLSGGVPAVAAPGYLARPGWIISRNVPYVSHGTAEEVADLLLPAGRTAPVVILIHGGGWAFGDKLDVADIANELVGHGIAVINVNYRLARLEDPATQWPAQLQDVQAAARWARANAAALHLDPERLCAAGESAGGQMAMFLGYLKRSQPGDRSGQNAKLAPDVSCVGQVSGIANFTHPHLVNSFLRQPLFGGENFAEAPALWKSASPLLFIREDSVPTFVVQGKTDPMVTNEMARELTRTLKAHGVEAVELDVDGGHVFQDTPSDQRVGALLRMMQFFERHLGLGER